MMTKALLAFAQWAIQKVDIHFVFNLCFLFEIIYALEIHKAVLNHLMYCGMHLFWIVRLLQRNQTVTITKYLRRKLLRFASSSVLELLNLVTAKKQCMLRTCQAQTCLQETEHCDICIRILGPAIGKCREMKELYLFVCCCCYLRKIYFLVDLSRS